MASAVTEFCWVSASPAGAVTMSTEHRRRQSRRDAPAASRWSRISCFSGGFELIVGSFVGAGARERTCEPGHSPGSGMESELWHLLLRREGEDMRKLTHLRVL